MPRPGRRPWYSVMGAEPPAEPVQATDQVTFTLFLAVLDLGVVNAAGQEYVNSGLPASQSSGEHVGRLAIITAAASILAGGVGTGMPAVPAASSCSYLQAD